MKEKFFLVREITEFYMNESKHYFKMEMDVCDEFGDIERITVDFNSYEFLNELYVNDIIPNLKKNLKEGIEEMDLENIQELLL
tara:strand:+ start:744 stop:992 length:249 start_codon:yes stop_codon:yes gene_type:complete